MEKVVITEKFLKTLVALANEYGWEGDYFEVCAFIEWIYKKAGKEITDEELTPTRQ